MILHPANYFRLMLLCDFLRNKIPNKRNQCFFIIASYNMKITIYYTLKLL